MTFLLPPGIKGLRKKEAHTHGDIQLSILIPSFQRHCESQENL